MDSLVGKLRPSIQNNIPGLAWPAHQIKSGNIEEWWWCCLVTSPHLHCQSDLVN